jgi:teichoic acid transport system ATP-binding protein
VSSLPESKELTVSVRDLKLNYKTNVTKRPNFKEALLHFGRGEKTAITVEALKGISFDVYRGTILGVIGANGAGKSTLMKAIAGLLPPTEGEIELRGKVSCMITLKCRCVPIRQAWPADWALLLQRQLTPKSS